MTKHFLISPRSGKLRKPDYVSKTIIFSGGESEIATTGDEAFEVCTRDTDTLTAKNSVALRRNSFKANFDKYKEVSLKAALDRKRDATSPLLGDQKLKHMKESHIQA